MANRSNALPHPTRVARRLASVRRPELRYARRRRNGLRPTLNQAASLLPERPPRVGELVEVRSRRWLVEGVEDAAPPTSPRVSLACADDDAQGQTLEVYWDFEIDRRILEQESMEQHRRQGLRPAPSLQRLPAHPALELRHRHRPESFPVAVSRRHQDRRLPDGAAAQGAAPAARESLHRRRHRPGQDHRGRSHRS